MIFWEIFDILGIFWNFRKFLIFGKFLIFWEVIDFSENLGWTIKWYWLVLRIFCWCPTGVFSKISWNRKMAFLLQRLQAAMFCESFLLSILNFPPKFHRQMSTGDFNDVNNSTINNTEIRNKKLTANLLNKNHHSKVVLIYRIAGWKKYLKIIKPHFLKLSSIFYLKASKSGAFVRFDQI